MSTSNPAAATAGRARLSYVDGVRAIAALYVVLHHVWFTVYPEYPRNTGPATVGWLVYGHLAVAVFIVVSGFSLTIAPARRGYELGGLIRFLRRRAWRIIPPYWAALALSALVFGVLTRDLTGSAISAKGLVVHGLLLQDVINTPKPNGAFWSIAIEWQIYLLFPLVLLIRRRVGAWLMTAFACVGVIAAQLVAGFFPPLHGLVNFTPQFFALFVLGSAAAAAVSLAGAPRGLAASGAAGFAAFASLAWWQGPIWVDRYYFWVDLFVGLSAAALLAGLAHQQARPLSAVLRWRPLVAVGVFSYSVYLVHLPLLWIVAHFVVNDVTDDRLTRFWMLLVLGIPVVLAGSYVFHLGFERPFLEHRSLRSLTLAIRPRTADSAATGSAARTRTPQQVPPEPPKAEAS